MLPEDPDEWPPEIDGLIGTMIRQQMLPEDPDEWPPEIDGLIATMIRQQKAEASANPKTEAD